jgi:hypothetical protein
MLSNNAYFRGNIILKILIGLYNTYNRLKLQVVIRQTVYELSHKKIITVHLADNIGKYQKMRQ